MTIMRYLIAVETKTWTRAIGLDRIAQLALAANVTGLGLSHGVFTFINILKNFGNSADNLR